MKKLIRSENFARRLIAARVEHGKKQYEVAEAMNVSPVTMNRFEKGERTPDVMQIKELAGYIPIDLNWLITGETYRLGVPIHVERVDHVVRDEEGKIVNLEKRILVPGCENSEEAYQVTDWSMSPRILKNDYVLVDRETPAVGDLVAYRDDHWKVKVGWLRAFNGEGERYLVAENQEYGRIEESKCHIIGRVVSSLRIDRYL